MPYGTLCYRHVLNVMMATNFVPSKIKDTNSFAGHCVALEHNIHDSIFYSEFDFSLLFEIQRSFKEGMVIPDIIDDRLRVLCHIKSS